MKNWRTPLIILTAWLAIVTVGGAWLVVKILEVAQTNSDFICSFGTAVNAGKIKQQPGESDHDFRRRVGISRQFVHKLNEIQDCNPPAVIRIARESKPALHQEGSDSHEQHPSASQTEAPSQVSQSETGGDASTGSSPPSQPGPPPSGGGSDGNGGSAGTTPTPTPPSPAPVVPLPQLPEPAQQAVDHACDAAPVHLPICQ